MTAANDPKTGPDGTNLRREARIEATIKVSVRRGSRETSFETRDVSFKGLFLQTTEPPALRSLVRLRLALPGREIEVHAMAVHVADTSGGPSGVGVQFWGLSGPDRVVWDGFVQGLIQARREDANQGADALTPSGIRTVGWAPDKAKK
jgi:hypothetical protein